LPARIKKMNC